MSKAAPCCNGLLGIHRGVLAGRQHCPYAATTAGTDAVDPADRCNADRTQGLGDGNGDLDCRKRHRTTALGPLIFVMPRKNLPSFRLRFPPSEIPKWSARYDYPGESELIAGPMAAAKQRGYLEHPEFVAVAEWKSPRPRKRIASNAPALVEEITRVALAPVTSPRLSIEVLTILDGVSWPMASVILHFCHPTPLPILDFRALWSLSVDAPTPYTFSFWNAYAEFTQQLAKKAQTDKRTLDRALWKYSQLHQR